MPIQEIVLSKQQWQRTFIVAIAIYAIGVLAGILPESFGVHYYFLEFAFLIGIGVGTITSLVACIGLATALDAGSAVAAGLSVLFLAFFVPMAFEHFGRSFSIHDESGIAFILFILAARIGAALVLVIGFVRMARMPE